MTDLLRPSAGSGNAATRTTPRPARPIVVSAVLSAAIAAGAGLVVFVGLATVGWLAGGSGSIAGAVRIGCTAWLVGHGGAVTVDGTAITAAPLGLVLVLAAVLYVVTCWTSAASAVVTAQDLGGFAAITGVGYGLVLGVVALAASTSDTSVDVVRAAGIGFVLAAAAAGLAGARTSGLLRQRWSGLSADLRAGALGVLSGVGTLLASSLLLVLALLVVHLSTVGTLFTGLGAGLFGGATVVVLCLAVLPNLVLWATSALLGPGFLLGSDTSVTLTNVSLGRVPGLPVLAALPAPGVLPWWAMTLALVPVLCGGVAGYVATTRSTPRRVQDRLVLGAATGAAAGAVIGVLVVASGGAIGPGRMADVGPRAALCVLAAVVAMAVGGALGSAVGHYREARADVAGPGADRV